MNRYFEEDKRATAEICGEPEPDVVILAWASRKRHLFINDVLLCEKRHKTTDGYSAKGRHYISYQLDMPKEPMRNPDMTHTHGDGIIPAMPLDEIVIPMTPDFRQYWEKKDGLKSVIQKGLDRRSICAACQKRYDKIFMPTAFLSNS